MASPKILVFAGSTRTGALSGKLAALAAKELALADADVTRISLADYPLPIYNGDFEKEHGIPENAVRLAKLISTHTDSEYTGQNSKRIPIPGKREGQNLKL